MIEDRSRMLIATVQKLLSRGARTNILRILSKTHAADIAILLQSLRSELRLEVFQMVEPDSKRAEVLSHLDSEIQEEIFDLLGRQEFLLLVGLMDSDDAADLLGALDAEESQEILSQMVTEDSQEVAELMGYPEDSAGGLMSSEHLSVNQSLTVDQAIKCIQTEGEEGKVTFYLYVVNDHDQLVGVVSLKQLLMSKRQEALKQIMHTDVISVGVTTDQDEVAQIVEKYDFLALPVVEGNNQLVGVITVDDVIDVIREAAEEDLLAMGRAGWGVNVTVFDHLRARGPWVLLAFLGGCFCFALVYFFGQLSNSSSELGQLWLVAAFVPMVLTLGATTGSQAAAVAVGAIRSGRFEAGKARAHLKKEVQLGILMSLILGGLVFAIFAVGELIFDPYNLSLGFSLAVSIQILLAVLIGSTVPLVLHRIGLDPVIASVPLVTIVADVAAVAILFGITRVL